jgi:hypothetical protein
MNSTIDMSTPVTRGELKEELWGLESRFDQKLGGLESRFDQKLGGLESRFDQRLRGLESRFDQKLGGLESRFDQKLGGLESNFNEKLQRLESGFDQKLELWVGAVLARIRDSEQRLLGELAQHAGAIQEVLSKQISAIDDKYRELPDRVFRLEAEVFASDDEPQRNR